MTGTYLQTKMKMTESWRQLGVAVTVQLGLLTSIMASAARSKWQTFPITQREIKVFKYKGVLFFFVSCLTHDPDQ